MPDSATLPAATMAGTASARGTLAFITLASGGHAGATIRDLRLARAVRRRGYGVVVYWMMGSNRNLLGPGIASRRLASGARYLARFPLAVTDFIARNLDLRREERQHRAEQAWPRLQSRALRNIAVSMSRPGTGDPGMVRRLERLLRRDRVTHVLAGSGTIAALTEAVAARGRVAFRSHVTLQGDDLLLPYLSGEAERAALKRRLAEIARQPYAVSVSQAYARDSERLLDLPPGLLPVLYPGLELAAPVPRAAALAAVRRLLPDYDPARPLVTFVGRTDSEKGLDLLLYALRILQERGLRPQIVIAGAPCFGADYERACHRIARQIELPARFIGTVREPDRDALFALSRCVVYPVVHLEAFGMVAPEALAQGAPVIVPRRGGLVEGVTDGVRSGGLFFEPWDSGDLARQIAALLTDDALHARLTSAGPELARRFDVEVIADQLLDQLGLARTAAAA